MVASKKIPGARHLMNPLIEALRALGGSGTTDEIYDKVGEVLNLPDEILEIPHGNKPGGRTELAFRLGWTRTLLKKYGVLDNSSRGVWTLTPLAKDIDKVNVREVLKKVRELYSGTNQLSSDEPISDKSSATNDLEKPEEAQDWRENLQKTLLTMEPAAFERLTQRILRESGFVQVEVTGRSGDGGIDGKGIVRVSGLLSFHVMFQCKKYQGSVTSSQVRDFRGALQGRADKGILITTGAFTRDAAKEAIRDGAPPIDLIDGEQLIDKLKELSLGVTTRLVELVEIDINWFSQI